MAYKIYGTNQPYTGKVVMIGNRLYTTTGGTLEGNSKEVVETTGTAANKNTSDALPTIATQAPSRAAPSTRGGNTVTRTFQAPRTPRYYRPDGTIVEVGYNLHQHQDGTIMTEHSMGPEDNSVVVTTTPPGNRNRSTTTRTTRRRMNRTNNQNGGGGMGGSY